MQEYSMKEILQECKNKNIKNIAFVTNTFSKAGNDYESGGDCFEEGTRINICYISAYDPKTHETIQISQELFEDNKHARLMRSCTNGDIIQYRKSTLDTWDIGLPANGEIYHIVRNFSHEKRLQVFKNLYNAVYGRTK